MVLHVFLVPIISCHDKLWGLARRVFTLFQSIHSIAYHQGDDDDEEEGEGDHGLVGEEGLHGVEGEEKGGARPQFLMLLCLVFLVGTDWVGVDLNKVMFWHLLAKEAEGRLQ